MAIYDSIRHTTIITIQLQCIVIGNALNVYAMMMLLSHVAHHRTVVWRILHDHCETSVISDAAAERPPLRPVAARQRSPSAQQPSGAAQRSTAGMAVTVTLCGTGQDGDMGLKRRVIRTTYVASLNEGMRDN